MAENKFDNPNRKFDVANKDHTYKSIFYLPFNDSFFILPYNYSIGIKTVGIQFLFISNPYINSILSLKSNVL